MLDSWKASVRHLKAESYALYIAYRDPRTPFYAKLLTAIVVAYAFSPIDLIPDFIPVLGYLDDLLLVPLGVWIALKLIPPLVMAESRERAQTMVISGERPFGRIMLVVIVALWIVGLAFLIYTGYRLAASL